MKQKLFLTLFLNSLLFQNAFSQWITSSNMQENRSAHVSALLSDGKVLVAGGYNTTDHLKTAEIYDPANENWSSSQNEMAFEHSYGTATLLNNDNVLVVGGWNGNTNLDACEIFDASSYSWSTIASLSIGRSDHTATKLQNGKILIVGGYDGTINLNSCELFDPTTNTWESVSSLNTGRSSHTATLLNDGRVLVTGGFNPDANFQVISTEIYDPTSNSWSYGPDMAAGRNQHAACLLPDGNVLISGGEAFTGQVPYAFEGLTSVEIFNSSTNSFTSANSLPTGLSFHEQVVIGNYVMTIAGKEKTDYFDGNFTFLNGKTYLYDIESDSWTLSELITDGRLYFSANKLSDNRILVCGGGSNTVEIYESSLNVNLLERKEFVSVFPNPSKDILNIKSNNSEIYELKIKDLSGRTLNNLKISNSGINKLDVSTFSAGIYLIEFMLDNKQVELKFVKE
jgi:hypothetical protein